MTCQKMLDMKTLLAIIIYVTTKETAYIGVSPSGKAAGFGPAIRRFESFRPRILKRSPLGLLFNIHLL